jgi:hypothetical protein
LLLAATCIGSGYYPRFAATLEEPTCLASRHKSLGPRQTGGTPPLHSPEEVELFLDACEIAIAGGEGGFARGGEGGGETVDVGDIRPPLQRKVKWALPGVAGPQRLKRGHSIPTRSGQVLRPHKAERAPRVEAGRPFCIFVK